MDLHNRLHHTAVIGAGGKMGSGIALLLAQEMTVASLRDSRKPHQLTLMDVNEGALEGLKKYLHKQAEKFALKNADSLKPLLPNTADDAALAKQFSDRMLSLLRFTTGLQDVRNQGLVFEAILERIALKVKVFTALKTQNPEAFFFSNTSSIPIHELDEQVDLGGRIIGFHFYNPPAVQRLVELIIPQKVNPELPPLAKTLGERLRKTIITSNDVAGFIGNGHFMRDGLHGISAAEQLVGADMAFHQAIYLVNRVSQDFLVRPMGIFQLIDYVGLDIFQSILGIMKRHFPGETLHSALVDELVAAGVKGGQYPDGSQKDGFLKYEAGGIAAVWDKAAGTYRSLDEGDWRSTTEAYLGALPGNYQPWKSLLKDPERHQKLAAYFSSLQEMDSAGARLSVNYLRRSRAIGEQLLSGGVAHSADDVNGVLMNGFFHLYGPINDYI